MVKILKSVPFFVLSVFLLGYYAVKAWQVFLNDCPNNDFLSWDENIRLSQVLDQSVDLRNGNYWNGILPFFESPTWPPLRSLTTFLLLYLPTDWPIPWRDSFQGLLYLILTFPALFLILIRMTNSMFWGSAFSFFVMVLCIQTREIPVYSLTSMLETQAMFFLLLATFSVYQLYLEDNQKQEKNSTKYLVFISLFGFYFTKYPYGILFFISCIVYEVIRSGRTYKDFVIYLYKNYAKGFRLFYLVFVVAMVLSLPIVRVVSDINLNQRQFKSFMFYITVLLFIDFSSFIYRKREIVKSILPRTVQILWVYAIFPAFFWLFLNPDRVNALIDAQMIVNQYTRSFFLTLWTEPGLDPMVPGVFDFIWGFRALLLISCVSLFYFIARSGYKIQDKLKDPLLAASLILFLELLILELTTGNKQPRHVLQFIPAMGVLGFVWIHRFVQAAENRNHRILSHVVLISVMSLVGYNLFSEEGLLTGRFFETRAMCYRGKDVRIFQPAREIAEQLTPEKNYILINAFHDQSKYSTKGRLIASDFDLAMKLKTYTKGSVRNDHKYRWKDWNQFDSILLLSDSCPDSFVEEKFENRSKMLTVKSTLLKTYRESSGIACLQEYQIIK